VCTKHPWTQHITCGCTLLLCGKYDSTVCTLRRRVVCPKTAELFGNTHPVAQWPMMNTNECSVVPAKTTVRTGPTECTYATAPTLYLLLTHLSVTLRFPHNHHVHCSLSSKFFDHLLLLRAKMWCSARNGLVESHSTGTFHAIINPPGEDYSWGDIFWWHLPANTAWLFVGAKTGPAVLSPTTRHGANRQNRCT